MAVIAIVAGALTLDVKVLLVGIGVIAVVGLVFGLSRATGDS